jgi:TonB family protein
LSARIEVAVFEGHRLIGRRSFDGGIVTVGSAPGCALRFVGVAGIAHSHALLWDDGGALTIVASAGASIALNGEVVSMARPGPEDIVSIGPLDLRFERRDGTEVAEPEAGVPEVEEREDDEPTCVRTRDDGDDDVEEGFLEPFSLLEQVTRSSGVTGGELTLQLVATRGGRLNQHQHEIVRCYERALLGSRGLAGTVRMGWTIAPGGGVAAVRIQRSTVGSSAVTACISSAIRGWHFPSPRGGSVTVTFPWVFRPAAQ